MKKPNREKMWFQLHAGEKRFARSIRPIDAKRKAKKSRKRKDRLKPLEAPAKLDLYSYKNQQKFILFIERLRKQGSTQGKVFISFRNTHRITAAAGLFLVAETDRLTKAFPQLSIKCSFPPTQAEGKYHNTHSVVESALKQIGFFKLINQPSNKPTNQASVRRWRQLSGNIADGSLVQSLLDTVKDRISKSAQRKMYRGAIEAIANCVDHAYPHPRPDGLQLIDNRWWMLVGLDEYKMSVIVCDLGVGIPETLPRKHSKSLLSTIFNKFGIIDESDGELIRASTFIRRTRTSLTNRGKGGQDFRSIVDAFPSAQLTIRSNKGAFSLTGSDCRPVRVDRGRRFVAGTAQTEAVSNLSMSLRGTLLEWTVSLEDLAS